MADNITALANTGSGTDVLATDDIGGVHYPRNKIGFGSDGDYSDVHSGNPFPVALSGRITENATQDQVASPVRPCPQKYIDVSFAEVGSGLPSPFVTLKQTGTGQTVNQSAGNLVITAGTTVNAETVIRSNDSFSGALTLRVAHQLSQRVSNNNFYIELVDVIGDTLTYNIVNATTVDVTKTAHGFTTQNVGQRMDLCCITGAAGIPMEGVIASIPDANTIRFTVAGWPATGTGTLSLTGYNKVELQFTSTSATSLNFNTRRKGWQNTATAVTINTTAAQEMVILNLENGVASLLDKTTAMGNVALNRTAWDVNIPNVDVQLFLQLRAKNGTAAPTATTWTVGMFRVEDYVPTQVSLTSTRHQSIQTPMNVNGSVGVSGTVSATVANGTVQPVVPQTPYFVNSAASTNGALILTGTSGLQALYATNTGASVAYVKLYNKATAPTVGTDVPEMIIPVPAAVSGVPGVAQLPIGFSGFRFALGLGIAITGGAADTDTTAVAAGQVKVKLSRTT